MMTAVDGSVTKKLWERFQEWVRQLGRKPKIGLALGSGGAWGVAHIGVLSVLHELEIPIAYLSGCSAGAFVGALYAGGVEGAALDECGRRYGWRDAGRLRGNGVVATVMSNLGLERHLEGLGLSLIRTKVGDRYVVEEMRRGDYNVGGEQSGHVVFSDFTTTGDGLVTALQVLSVVVQSAKTVSEVCRRFDPVPQLLKSIRFKGGNPLEDPAVKAAVEAGRLRLGKGGRLIIRPSGTEPLIRVMAEGDDQDVIMSVVNDIVASIDRHATASAA